MNLQIKNKENTAFKGHYKFTLATLETPEQWELNNKIGALVDTLEEGYDDNKIRAEIRSLQDKLNSICRTDVLEYDNIIPTVGRTLIANNLTDATPDNSMLLNKAAVGTGTNTPVNGDVQLQTETYRNDLASKTNSSNIAYATAFFTATEVTGTFREAGIFANATATANSGVLFSRVAINITKTNTQTLTLDWTLTIS